jgi:hypothetical protein
MDVFRAIILLCFVRLEMIPNFNWKSAAPTKIVKIWLLLIELIKNINTENLKCNIREMKIHLLFFITPGFSEIFKYIKQLYFLISKMSIAILRNNQKIKIYSNCKFKKKSPQLMKSSRDTQKYSLKNPYSIWIICMVDIVA